MAVPGPAQLGRGVIVAGGAAAPAPWADAPRVVVDEAVLADPEPVVAVLHRYWTTRTPVVVDLRVPVEALREPETDPRPPHALTPAFSFARERLYFLARANNYDARAGTPRWWPAREAEALGARPGDTTDIVLPDGTAAWCDGGPRAVGSGVSIVHRYALEAKELRIDRDGTSRSAVGLAPDQQAAVLHAGGPARILAPAGSGKTTVLTARFRHLVVERGYGAASVTALAYNKRAGDEMKARLADLPSSALRKVRTLNSFGYDILQRAHPNRRVIDEIEVRRRIEPLLKVRYKANTDVLAPYLDALEEIRLGLRDPERVEADRGDVDGLAAMYRAYTERLERDDVTDFDGQIYGAVALLLREPEMRAALQRECRHLLVDEFQDLRPAHVLLLRLVAAPGYDVFGVGDDDQVIYGYSGADPDFLIRFDSYFPAAADHPLEVNYRCPPVVVDAARSLLGHNRRRVPKTIRAARADVSDALHVERVPGETLAPRAVERVTSWLGAGIQPDHIAVLCRVNAGLLPVQVLARDAGLPVTVAVGERFLTRTGVRAALAYLRLANAVAAGERLHNRDLLEVVRRPSRRLSKRTVEVLGRRRITLERLRDFADGLDGTDATRLHDFADDLAALAAQRDAPALLRTVRDDIGLGQAMGTLDRSGKGRDASHLDDLTALIAIAAAHPEPTTFESWLREHLRGADDAGDPSQPGKVTLSTVHRVKGMEWDHVVVLGAHEGLMPHRLADDVEEERRVFHVALTRARTEVVLLAEASARAPFVDEALGHAGPRPRATAQLADVIPLPRAASADDALFEALREWRLSRARDDGLPPYVVFHDATLTEIAAAKPNSYRALARIKGVGPAKIQKYGADVLRVVAEHA